MNRSFKNWLAQEAEMAIGSDGKNSQTTQSAQAATKVAQGWLADKSNSGAAAKMAGKGGSTIASQLTNAAAEATDKASNSIAGKTTAPQVATAIGKSLGVKNTFNLSFMQKK